MGRQLLSNIHTTHTFLNAGVRSKSGAVLRKCGHNCVSKVRPKGAKGVETGGAELPSRQKSPEQGIQFKTDTICLKNRRSLVKAQEAARNTVQQAQRWWRLEAGLAGF